MNNPDTSPSSLPLRGPVNSPRRAILASHLIFTGYGHWLSNDPRGSGSHETRKIELKQLGDVHLGRRQIQPPRDEVKLFYRRAEHLLEHDPIWFGETAKETIAAVFGNAAKIHGYTIWECAVCSNHAHLVVRTHRERSETIWSNLAHAAVLALRRAKIVPSDHPVWSHRIYKVFKYTPQEVHAAIKYVNDNPTKEGLPRQNWEFVQPCKL